jgi:hypothetical protein
VADGLSHQPQAPGDPEQQPWDHEGEGSDGLCGYSKSNPGDPDPMDFEEFKHKIDTRGGYLVEAENCSRTSMKCMP